MVIRLQRYNLADLFQQILIYILLFSHSQIKHHFYFEFIFSISFVMLLDQADDG